ncbi:RtcB family protein [Deinococcus sp. SM5_A1]|uniref:RtcB family protein n=1 Tax=Deinococcus sp. SM5_A1 TaxID=3379094 RepID=UPI00385F03B0
MQSVLVRIELRAGDTRKHRTKDGALHFDKLVPVAPANYGEIEGHYSTDGDALDALVFAPAPLDLGDTVEALPVGVLLRPDEDHKVVCVVPGFTLPTDYLEELRLFFTALGSRFRSGSEQDLTRVLQEARCRRALPALRLQPQGNHSHLSGDGTVLYRATAELARHFEVHAPHAALRLLSELPYVRTPLRAFPDLEDERPIPAGVAVLTDAPYLLPFALGQSACGFRVITTDLHVDDLRKDTLHRLSRALEEAVAPDAPDRRALAARMSLEQVLTQGLGALIEGGLAHPADAERTEWGGVVQGASSQFASAAQTQAQKQFASSGAWGHYLELASVHDACQNPYGLRTGQVLLLVHMGGRFVWPAVRDSHLSALVMAALREGWATPAQVARGQFGVRIDHVAGAHFLADFRATLNYAFANRAAMQVLLAQVLQRDFGAQATLLSDNTHVSLDQVERGGQSLLLHRNGQHWLRPPHGGCTPAGFQASGQPVLLLGAPGVPSVLLQPHSTATDLALVAHGIASGPGGTVPQEYPEFEDVLHNTSFRPDPTVARTNLARAITLSEHTHVAAVLRPLANLRASGERSPRHA